MRRPSPRQARIVPQRPTVASAVTAAAAAHRKPPTITMMTMIMTTCKLAASKSTPSPSQPPIPLPPPYSKHIVQGESVNDMQFRPESWTISYHRAQPRRPKKKKKRNRKLFTSFCQTSPKKIENSADLRCVNKPWRAGSWKQKIFRIFNGVQIPRWPSRPSTPLDLRAIVNVLFLNHLILIYLPPHFFPTIFVFVPSSLLGDR